MKLKTFLKENLTILIAFMLPVGLIALVAVSVYLPGLFINTNYNFVYVACTDSSNYHSYNCEDYLQKKYSVIDKQLTINKVDFNNNEDYNNRPDNDENYNTRIFLHDTESNESREITLKEAQTLSLDDLLTSPDGVTVSGEYDRNHGGGSFLFGGYSSSYAYYLSKGSGRKKLNLIGGSDRYNYQNNIRFIGWETAQRN